MPENQPTERTGHLVPCERGANSHLRTQGRLVHVSSTLSILPTKVGSTLSILVHVCETAQMTGRSYDVCEGKHPLR